jgi:hypothetical protein
MGVLEKAMGALSEFSLIRVLPKAAEHAGILA